MKKLRWILTAAIGVVVAAGAAQAVEPSLTWLGHAAFEFTTRNGTVFLIDPWTTNPKAPKNISFKNVAGILVTHGHADHVGEAFDLAKKFNAPFVASYELTEIAKKHGVTKVLPLNPNGSTVIGDVTITAVPAVHSSSYQEGDNILYAGAPIGFVVEEFGAPAFYHAGDTGLFSDMALIAQLYHPNVALLPIGGVYTMKPMEAAAATRVLQVATVVPIHFGTFPALSGTPADLQKEIKKLGMQTRVVELKPGQAVTLKELAAATTH